MMPIRKRHTGFTLVEVLVAIAIFAVLSAAGWVVFDQLIKNRDRNAQYAAQLHQLQTAYAQMLRDLSQAVPIAGKKANQSYPALFLDRDHLQFNKAGVLDPLQQGLDAYEYIEYGYDVDRQALIRYQFPYIYRQQNRQMQGDVVLAPVDNVRFQALDPALQQRWPAQTVTDSTAAAYMLTQLPRGVEVTFRYQQRDYRWVFALVTGFPASNTTTSTTSQ